MKRVEKPKHSAKQIEYITKYERIAYVKLMLRIRSDDVLVLDKLKSVKSKNGYIIDLIREDAVKSLKV